jgi:TolB-like protein/Flp pilus assembly protein TadD
MAVYDVGSQDGRPYIVTELLEGATLRERLAAGALGARKTTEYAGQIAQGLAAAHAKSIVHRDLKPENVFVTQDERVKILDFGVAKLGAGVEGTAPSGTAATEAHRTEPGTVLGTVAYMSPEQVRGERADARSDIFSFGTVVYEMLTGRHPFQRGSPGETMAAILHEEPPPPSEATSGPPPSLEGVVLHCLEKSPAARFQSAGDIAFHLSTASSSTESRPVPPRSRNAGIAIGAIVAFGALFLGALFYLRPRHDAGAAARRVAVLPFENLGSPEDDYFADGIADAVRGKLTTLPGVAVIARGSSTPYKKTKKTPGEIAKELGVRYLLSATVRWQKGSGAASRVEVSPELVEIPEAGAPTSKWAEPFAASLTDVFQVQSDIAARVARAMGDALTAGDASRLAATPTRSLEAYDAFLKGQQEWGHGGIDPASLRRELGHYERAVSLDPGFADAWASLSETLSLLNEYTPGEFPLERSRTAAERAIAVAPQNPMGYRALGTYYRFHFENERAIEQYKKSQALAPSDERGDVGLALAKKAMGHWEEAVAYLRRAESIDPLTLSVRRFLAECLLDLRRYGEARSAADRGLAIAPGDPTLVFLKCMTYLGEGNLAAARAAVGEASSFERLAADAPTWMFDREQRDRLFRMTPEAFDDDRGRWGLALAEGYLAQGDLASARRYAEESRKGFEERLAKAPDEDSGHAWLGVALAILGRKDDAIRAGRRAVELMPFGREAETAAYDRQLLAKIYALVGEPDQALDLLEQLLVIPSDYSPGWLRIDPNFDSLRGNPRFQKLVASKP